VPVEIRAQVLEVGFDARIPLVTGDPVPGELPGKARLEICEPGIFQNVLSPAPY